MDQSQINLFMSKNMNNFSPVQISDIKSKLQNMPEEKSSIVVGLEFRDTTTILLISLFLGELGVDRFMLGNVGMGIFKLLTLGCCGIMWLIDLINYKKLTHNYNYQKFIETITTL